MSKVDFKLIAFFGGGEEFIRRYDVETVEMTEYAFNFNNHDIKWNSQPIGTFLLDILVKENMENMGEIVLKYLKEDEEMNNSFETITRGDIIGSNLSAEETEDLCDIFLEALEKCFDIDYQGGKYKGMTAAQRYHKYRKTVLFNRSIQFYSEELGNKFYEHKRKDNNIEIVQGYIGSLSAIRYVSFVEMIKNNNLIRKCKFCGKYFVLDRLNSYYCLRPAKIYENGEIRACRDIGPMSNYNKKLEDESLVQLYRKFYRKMHARQTARKKEKRIDQTQFETWTRLAKEKLVQAQSGCITEEEFEKWLSEIKIMQ
jgi:hypothetical protein